MAKSKTEKGMTNVKTRIAENSKEAVRKPIKQRVNGFKLDLAWNSTIAMTVLWVLMDQVAYVVDATETNTYMRHRA
jgi:hypothetical protein